MKNSFYILVLAGIIFSAFASTGIKQENVLICGVGKNIEPFLPNMMQKIEALGDNFNDYRVIIYENNSEDKTAGALKKWARKNDKVIIISETVSADELSKRTRAHAKRDHAPCRMELIAYARNQVLQKALSPEFEDFKLLIMTDLDFAQGWQVKDVINSCLIETPWDCITANGVDYRGVYYDRYAYRDEQFIFGPELIGEDFWDELYRTPLRLVPGSGLKKVYSAFGGLAIYKKEALKGCRYSGYVTEDLKALMENLVSNMSKKHKQYVLYKKIIDQDGAELPIIFQPNCGYDSPVVCEHSTLHATMFLNGHNNIFINPDLICRY